MKEAIGNSMVFNLVIIFVGVFIALFVGSISYSKGFKVRNRIIDIIEAHEGYSKDASAEIDENLASIGYPISDKVCSEYNGKKPMNINSPYRYCLYEYDTSKGNYYGVTVFIRFDFPLIQEFLEFGVYGETRIIFNKNEVEN